MSREVDCVPGGRRRRPEYRSSPTDKTTAGDGKGRYFICACAVKEGPVSAVVASPARGVEDLDAVRALQHALYRAAKADPGRRFHALHDKVLRRDVMWRAWVQVRRNGGAAGIDRVTLDAVEEYGVIRLLDELITDLRDGRWRPVPARRGFISQPGGTARGAPPSS